MPIVYRNQFWMHVQIGPPEIIFSIERIYFTITLETNTPYRNIWSVKRWMAFYEDRGYNKAYQSTINVTNLSLWVVVDNRWIWIFQNLPLLGFCNSIEAVVTYLAFKTPANIIHSPEHFSEKMKGAQFII